MYGIAKYGDLKYGESTIVQDEDIENITSDLMKYLPIYYRKSKTMKEIQKSIAAELGLNLFLIRDLEKQFFVDTATWGLSIYEKELGIKTNLDLSYESRRENIISKYRSQGTVTKSMLINLAESFSGGEVDIIEYPSEYRFVIKFIGIKGIPRNMQGLIDMVERVKPAHLDYDFKYTYTVWNFIEVTWDSFNTKTWNDLKVYEGE